MLTPGPGGGHNWSPMSFNPSTGLVYVPSSTAASTHTRRMTTLSTSPAKRTWVLSGRRRRLQLRIQRAHPPRAGSSKTRPSPPAIGPTPPEGQRNILVAWDPVTQKERWHASGGGSLGGGTVSTAGNLVLQVIPDGRLVAYRADTGEKLLDLKTGLHGGMGPPITYHDSTASSTSL
jgi:quinohemoprotein ethanol dehydrogenase